MAKVQRLRTQRRYHYLPSSLYHIHPGIAVVYITLILVLGMLVTSQLVHLFAARNSPMLSFTSNDYSVQGEPTIDAKQINRVLAYYGSPAQNKGQALYDYGVQYGIDPAYALAFFMHESTFGTRGIATVTHSLGNIRATAGYESYKGYRMYSSWEAGFEDWYKLIKEQYMGEWRLYTVDQIIPVYAPAEDNNDEGAYIQSVKRAVDTWRQGKVKI